MGRIFSYENCYEHQEFECYHKMVGHHQLAMSISLSEMKQGIQTILRTVNGFVKYNAWNEHLDSRVAGYTANLHPVHPITGKIPNRH
jgi:hypothetical protein